MPWSSVKQLRTVLETEYSIDDVFDVRLHFFGKADLSEKRKKGAYAKSKKAKQAHGLLSMLFVVKYQNTATSLLYREVPLPW